MYRPVLRLMETGMLDLSSIITSVHKLKDIQEVMENLKTMSETKIKPMICFDGKD